MTDAEITHRVEQAMLGAMMSRPRSAAQLGVTTGHFGDARHQAIAAALTGNAGTERGLLGRLRAFFARRGRDAREIAAYMESLPDLCPEPAHIATYFKMLSADRDQRAAEAQARVQAQGNQVLSVASERLGDMRGRADKSTGMPLSVARLARALSGTAAQQGQPAPGPDPAQGQMRAQGQVPGRPGVAPQRAQPSSQPQAQTQVQTQKEPQDTAGRSSNSSPGLMGTTAGSGSLAALFVPGSYARPEDLQDMVLAGLMRHRDEAREALGWLPAGAFTGPRRELYTLIGQFARDGLDIDPVTLAWGAGQRNAARPADEPRTEHDGWLRPDYVLRTGALPTAPGAASVLGKMLLADQVCTANLGPDWHRAPRTETAPAPQPATAPQARQAKPAQAQNQSPQAQRARQSEQDQQNRMARQGRRASQSQQPAQVQQQPPGGPAAPGTQQNARPQQDGGAPQTQRGAPGANGQDQARVGRGGPYRQGPPAGSRPAARAGAPDAPARRVPAGGLIQQPPPVPGQNGPAQNR